ncbi:MAG: hypothetical protein Q8O30_07720 [Candidatus Omnitrophota bacterium]|nr:hypothetical protein [Candidatus Omnitrophota bacterium]
MKLSQLDKIKIGVVILLVIILIFAVANAIKGGKKQKKTPQQPSSAVVIPLTSTKSSGTSGGKSLYRRLEDESDKLNLERDPFMRSQSISVEKELSGINLSGIIWDAKNPKAIINGKIISVGSKIKENTVVVIKPDGVVLTDGEREFEINIKK